MFRAMESTLDKDATQNFLHINRQTLSTRVLLGVVNARSVDDLYHPK